MIFEEQWHGLLNYFQTGGPVMLPLLCVSLMTWLLIANRFFYLRRLKAKTMSSAEAWRHIKTNKLPDPGDGGIVGLLTRHFMQEQSGDPQLDRRILRETMITVSRPLECYLPLIGVLAALTPLLGLLGTVTGMMNTFEVMSLFGTGDAKGMASGISEALITTETGLIIAIPCMYMKNFLEHRAEELTQKVTSTGYYLQRHLQEASC